MTTRINTAKMTSVLWLLLRLYVGYQWLSAGWGKLTGAKPFDASAFVKGAIAKTVPATAGAKPVVQAWWGDFLKGTVLPNIKLFNVLVQSGEILIGLALILGFATLFASVMGLTMNLAFLLSGTVSSNPNLLFLQFVLIAAGGAYAGYLGIDYWFRPAFRRLGEKLLHVEDDTHHRHTPTIVSHV